MPIPWMVPVRRLIPYDLLDRGLQLEWQPFLGRTGNLLPDFSGYGKRGTNSGAIWQPGEYGPALSFDGINDYVYSADMEDEITTWGEATWEWFGLITETAGDWVERGLIGWRANTVAGGRHCGLFWQDNPNNLSLNVLANNAVVTSVIGGVDQTIVHHICGTYDGTNQYLYLDGVQVDSDAQSGTLEDYDPADQPVWLQRGLAGYCDGVVYLTRIYNRALLSSEVRRRYEICLGQQMQPMWVTMPAVAPAVSIPVMMDYYRRRRID